MATTRKKIVVYVEEEFKAEWERLAAKRFRPASVEAERLMVLELEQAYDSGELNRPTTAASSTHEETEGDIVADIMKKIMTAIVKGKTPNTQDLDIVANYMGLTLSETETLIEKMARNGNGKKSKASIH